MYRYFSLLIFFSLQNLLGFSQGSSAFSIQKFNTENGLPSNGIKGLQWDEESGFLWIATEAGIVRYNGMDFKIYNKENETHITNERILFLVKNNAGRIYTADARGNIFYVEKNNLRFLEKKTITTDSGNNFNSLAVSDALYRTKLDFRKGVYSPQFDRILPSGDSATYLTHLNRLMYYSQAVRSPTYILGDNMIISTGFKCKGDFFLADDQNNIFLYEQGSTLRKIEIIADGRPIHEFTRLIWVNGMRYPLLFSKEKAWAISYQNGKLIADLICNCIPADALIDHAQYDEKRKTLFIGTNSKGLIIIEKNRVESVRINGTSFAQRTSYYSQFELPDGNVMTNEGQVLGKNISNTTPLPVKGRFSTNILLVGDSVLWYAQPIANNGGSFLHSYNYRSGITKLYKNIKEDYELVMANSGAELYLATASGIYHLEGDELEMVYPYPKDNNAGPHFDMKEISPGVFAIARCNSLLRLDIHTRKLDTLFSSGNYCIRSIWQYHDYVFLGTYGGGLFVYKNGVVKPLPLDKNKYLLFTHCFVKDDSGYCWMSTNRGLFKARLSELTDVMDKNSSDVYYYYYGRNDGMEMTELNGGCTPCALVKKDKTISFPTMDGLLWVNPDSASTILPSGEIFIDEFIADNRFINTASLSSIRLPAMTDEITVRLGISAWTNKENIYVWYKLDNKDWRLIDIDKGFEIKLNNLTQGKYHLYFKKLNGFGAGNYSYKEIDFDITIPWYKRWWFYLLIAAAIAVLLRFYFDFRTRQLKLNQGRLEKLVTKKTKELVQKNEVLEKNDTIKTRLISIISHDIVTPLKFLTAAGKKLIEKRSQMTEKLQDETIGEMANTSQDLQLLSTNILNWIKYQNENRRLSREHFHLHELVEQVIGVLNSIARQKQNELVNNVDKQFIIHAYFEPLKIIIYNLVSNAINFTENGKIIVDSKKENGTEIITVSDQGVGMTPEQIQNIMADQFIISSVNIDNKKGNGLGYLIIKDLMKMMDGRFIIQSERGKGTMVSILINAKSPE